MSPNGPEAREVDWEVLPPEKKGRARKVGGVFSLLAKFMDELVRVPGTRFRFGLDPVIGLIPGIGDTASALISTFSLIYAAWCGVPRIILGRIALNILINETVGIIPGIGDAFSFWFKSNSRNRQLLSAYVAAPGASRKSDWVFVAAVLAILVLVVGVGLLVSVLLLRELFKILGGA